MSKPKIVRVYGRADSFDVEFDNTGGTHWTCEVPPDTKDGQYAVQLFAVNEFGEFAYWTGELFMCSGVCRLELHDSPYRVWFKAPNLELFVRKGCPHGRQN